MTKKQQREYEEALRRANPGEFVGVAPTGASEGAEPETPFMRGPYEFDQAHGQIHATGEGKDGRPIAYVCMASCYADYRKEAGTLLRDVERMACTGRLLSASEVMFRLLNDLDPFGLDQEHTWPEVKNYILTGEWKKEGEFEDA